MTQQDRARMDALEMVVEAAFAWWEAGASPSVEHARAVALREALHSLDALPAPQPQPEGEGVEVVTLGLMLSTRSPDPHYMACAEPGQEDPRFWMHVGNLTFTLPPKPAIPTIPATLALTREAGDAG